ncbi:flagellar hook-basal body complex protein FliE [Lentisphaerota bacterium WC36G]|nr:flagellar hook-basal body complex protein FliE [Lentisphaerae bacterium WC36]
MIEAISNDIFVNSSQGFEQLTTNFDSQINNSTVDNIQSSTAINDVNAPSFGDVLTSMVKGVDKKQDIAEMSIRDLAVGKTNNIQDVVLKLEEADVAFSLLREIRNKLLEGYKEVISMQS